MIRCFARSEPGALTGEHSSSAPSLPERQLAQAAHAARSASAAAAPPDAACTRPTRLFLHAAASGASAVRLERHAERAAAARDRWAAIGDAAATGPDDAGGGAVRPPAAQQLLARLGLLPERRAHTTDRSSGGDRVQQHVGDGCCVCRVRRCRQPLPLEREHVHEQKLAAVGLAAGAQSRAHAAQLVARLERVRHEQRRRLAVEPAGRLRTYARDARRLASLAGCLVAERPGTQPRSAALTRQREHVAAVLCAGHSQELLVLAAGVEHTAGLPARGVLAVHTERERVRERERDRTRRQMRLPSALCVRDPVRAAEPSSVSSTAHTERRCAAAALAASDGARAAELGRLLLRH